jgi:hypothetical protein
LNLGKGGTTVLTSSKRLKSKFELYKAISRQHSHDKSYADKRRRPITFEVGDYVYLKVSPMRGIRWFGVKRKLAPRYVGPYKIIERSGRVAYKLQLPLEMRAIFKFFHVSAEEMLTCS